MSSSFDALLDAIAQEQARTQAKPTGEVIAVSESASAAARAYESLRNVLEYDEEHLLRRNAIRRILNRRLGEDAPDVVARDVLHELIWAKYLPNKHIEESTIRLVSGILSKYRPLFEASHEQSEEDWLLDVLSTEVEYALVPPIVDEALANLAYQELRGRIQWATSVVSEQDRDLQLYIAVHRALLKSNAATLRFRALTLFFPAWTHASAHDAVVSDVVQALPTLMAAIERQLTHPAADPMFRLVRRYGFVFQVLRDVAVEDPHVIRGAHEGNMTSLEAAVTRAATARYRRFSGRLRRSVVRAVIFLFFSKTILALLIELPYERLVLHEASWTPLLVNIIFHPLLLGSIGLTVSLPERANTARVLELVRSLFGAGPDTTIIFKIRRAWERGHLSWVFRGLYAVFFLFTIGAIAFTLSQFHFNALSIGFFLFFLALVTFFGLKIRNSRKDLLVVDVGGGFLGTIADMLFLPIVRAGRWIALRAPKVNVFLFFLDSIIEAPFKSAIRLFEGWLAYLREKRDEI